MKRYVVVCFVLSFLVSAGAQTQVDLENQVRGELPVAQGGTAAGDAATARTNLGLTTDYLDENHTWLGRQEMLNFNTIRYAHLFSSSGSGTSVDRGFSPPATPGPTPSRTVGKRSYLYRALIESPRAPH